MADVIALSISKAEQFVVDLYAIPFDVAYNTTIYNDTDILESVVDILVENKIVDNHAECG